MRDQNVNTIPPQCDDRGRGCDHRPSSQMVATPLEKDSPDGVRAERNRRDERADCKEDVALSKQGAQWSPNEGQAKTDGTKGVAECPSRMNIDLRSRGFELQEASCESQHGHENERLSCDVDDEALNVSERELSAPCVVRGPNRRSEGRGQQGDSRTDQTTRGPGKAERSLDGPHYTQCRYNQENNPEDRPNQVVAMVATQ